MLEEGSDEAVRTAFRRPCKMWAIFDRPIEASP